MAVTKWITQNTASLSCSTCYCGSPQIVTVKEMCAFNRHVRLHRQENEDPDGPKTCTTCQKVFENKNQLLKHENLYHKKGKKDMGMIA